MSGVTLASGASPNAPPEPASRSASRRSWSSSRRAKTTVDRRRLRALMAIIEGVPHHGDVLSCRRSRRCRCALPICLTVGETTIRLAKTTETVLSMVARASGARRSRSRRPSPNVDAQHGVRAGCPFLRVPGEGAEELAKRVRRDRTTLCVCAETRDPDRPLKIVHTSRRSQPRPVRVRFEEIASKGASRRSGSPAHGGQGGGTAPL